MKGNIEKACFEKRLFKTRFFYIQKSSSFHKKFDDFCAHRSIKAPDCGRS